MKAVRRITGRVALLDRGDVDTDQIIPKQFLKRIERTGYGEFLFHDWRRDPAFELNRPEYAGASILVTGRNFGCGSSREHAAWALQDYGFEVIIAPSFGDIFAGNAAQIGLLTVALPAAQVRELAAAGELTVDLETQAIVKGGSSVQFEIDPFVRHRLLNGLDDIGLTLEHEPEITAFESRRHFQLDTTALPGGRPPRRGDPRSTAARAASAPVQAGDQT